MPVPKGYCDIAIAAQSGLELPLDFLTAHQWKKVARCEEGRLLAGRLKLAEAKEIQTWAESLGEHRNKICLRYAKPKNRTDMIGSWDDPFGIRHSWGGFMGAAKWFGDAHQDGSSSVALAVKRGVDLPTELRVREWRDKKENKDGFLFLDLMSQQDAKHLQQWLDRRSPDNVWYNDGTAQPPEESYRYLRVGPFVTKYEPNRPEGCAFGKWKDTFGVWKAASGGFDVGEWFGQRPGE